MKLQKSVSNQGSLNYNREVLFGKKIKIKEPFNMTLQQLKYIVTVADCGNITEVPIKV